MISSVEELIELIAQNESDSLEFKRNFGKDVEETAGAFANTMGGRSLIGVDKSGVIHGTTISNESLQEWANHISNASDPRIISDVKSFEVDGKTVVVIHTKEYPLKPVSIRGRCYRRVDASNRQMTPAEISEMHLQSRGTTWDATPSPGTSLENINLNKVNDYISKSRSTGRRKYQEEENPLDILNKLEFVRNGTPTWASVIAFGERPPIQAKVKCGKIRGTSKIVDDFVVDAHLLNQVEEVMDYMRRVFQLSYSISGKPEREEEWEYPLEAIREIVTNAVCHRDYSSSAQIQIKIFDDRLSIWNPGSLPLGMSVERLLDPNHNSIPRNKLIAMLFYDTGLIENYGSGIQRVIDECQRLDFPEPKFEEVENGFRVVFYKDIYTEDLLVKIGLDKRQIKAVIYVKEKGKITNTEYQSLNNVSKRTATRDLDELIQKSLIEQVGKTGKGTYYRLKGSQRGQTGHKGAINGSKGQKENPKQNRNNPETQTGQRGQKGATKEPKTPEEGGDN